jgi:hypothetical protein
MGWFRGIVVPLVEPKGTKHYFNPTHRFPSKPVRFYSHQRARNDLPKISKASVSLMR